MATRVTSHTPADTLFATDLRRKMRTAPEMTPVMPVNTPRRGEGGRGGGKGEGRGGRRGGGRGREGWWESEKQKGMLASARMHLNVVLSSHLSHMSQAVPPYKIPPSTLSVSQCSVNLHKSHMEGNVLLTLAKGRPLQWPPSLFMH